MASDKQAQQVIGAIKVVMAIGETIRDLGEVKAGVLYSTCAGIGLSMEDWQAVIRTLEAAKLIEYRRDHTIRWIGPVPPTVPDPHELDLHTWENEGGLPN